jgi:hypothetical protein
MFARSFIITAQNLFRQMTKALLFAFVAAWPNCGQADAVSLSGNESRLTSSDQSLLKSKLEHVYRFMMNIVSDADNRQTDDCKITVNFRDFAGQKTGFISKPNIPCRQVIEIESSYANSWKAQVVFAHELAHLIRHQHNSDEELWLDEGLAKFIEVHYSGLWPDQFEARLKQMPLFRLYDDEKDYQMQGLGYVTGFFLIHYLFERFGQEKLLQKLLTSKKTGWNSIEGALIELAEEDVIQVPRQWLTRNHIWSHFAVALIANTRNVAAYGLFLVDERHDRPSLEHPLLKCDLEARYPWSICYHLTNVNPQSDSRASFFLCLDDNHEPILNRETCKRQNRPILQVDLTPNTNEHGR